MAKKRTKQGTSRAAAEARRSQFVEGMLIHHGNQTKAAIHAGFPEKSAHVRGSELVKDRKVMALLETRRAEQLAKDKLTSDEVLVDMARALRFNPKRLYREDGSLIPMHELPDDVAMHIEAREEQEIYAEGAPIGRTVKVKYPKKTAVREQAMKHFGLYEADNRQKPAPTVNVGVLTVKPSEEHFRLVRARALQSA